MKNKNRWHIVLLVFVATVFLAACSGVVAEAVKIEPAMVEAIDGSEFQKLTLTDRAVERLAIETHPVEEMQMNGAKAMTVPYAAIIYGLNGETWVYTQTAVGTYVREAITVDYIQDGMVVLIDGPPMGTEVVTVGVAELYGTDTGVGK
jgi:hypothetical protein